MSWLEIIQKFLLPVIGVVNFFLGWFIWTMRQSFVDAKTFSEVRQKVNDLDSKMQQLPSQGALGELAIRLEKVHGDVRSLDAKILGLTQALARIERPLDMIMKHELERER